MTSGSSVRSAAPVRLHQSLTYIFDRQMRDFLDDYARDRLLHNIVGHLSKGVREAVLSWAFEYWRNVDSDLGKKIEEEFRAGSAG